MMGLGGFLELLVVLPSVIPTLIISSMTKFMDAGDSRSGSLLDCILVGKSLRNAI